MPLHIAFVDYEKAFHFIEHWAITNEINLSMIYSRRNLSKFTVLNSLRKIRKKIEQKGIQTLPSLTIQTYYASELSSILL